MTDIAQVRLLINDKTLPYHFTDAEIQAFLTMAGNSVFLAAAMALKSWAASLASAIDSERIGDYSYSKKQVANMIAIADNYVKMNATTPAMDWASMNLTNENDEEDI